MNRGAWLFVRFLVVLVAFTLSCSDRDSIRMPEQAVADVPLRWKEVAAGARGSCGLKTDGSIACWGGGLTPPAGAFSALIGDAWGGFCALAADGHASCWGLSAGQGLPHEDKFAQISAGIVDLCGIGPDKTLTCTSNAAPSPSGEFEQVTVAYAEACAVRADGSLVCWGGTPAIERKVPSGQFTQVALTVGFGCALGQDNAVTCWGGTVTPPTGAFKQISGGQFYMCGVRIDGTLACWGGPDFGVPDGEFTQVSVGSDQSCATSVDGQISCWGAEKPVGTFRQICNTTDPNGDYGTPSGGGCGIKVDGTLACWDGEHGAERIPSGEFAQLSCTGSQACALRGDGTAACWNFVSGSATAPTGQFVQISLAVGKVCGVRPDGTISCWIGGKESSPLEGDDFVEVETTASAGVCGLTNSGAIECAGMSTRQAVITPPSHGSFSQISANDTEACGIETDGTLNCWWNGTHAPTDGTFSQVSVPFALGGCALQTDGDADCWTNFGADEGPDFSTITGPFTQLSAGAYGFGCGLRPDGSVACWVQNELSGDTSVPPL
jgi:hypothetical protein